MTAPYQSNDSTYSGTNLCVITGASSGIGLETLRFFVKKGWYVCAISRNKHKLINITSGISNCFPVECDITDPKQVKKVFQQIYENYGNIECLINCAGTGLVKDFSTMTYNEWRSIIETNLTGIFLCTHEALRYMVPNGVVVNIGSLAGKRGYEKSVAYCASKFGVVGLSEALSVDTINNKIRIVLINPGLVDTPMSRELFPEKANKALSPNDIAKMIFFLVTELKDVKYVNVDLYGYIDIIR